MHERDTYLSDQDENSCHEDNNCDAQDETSDDCPVLDMMHMKRPAHDQRRPL